MANLTILRTYALKDPATLPPSILFHSTDKFITIFDAYPKSIFHFLVLPRLTSDSAAASPIPCLNRDTAANLKALLKGVEKDKAKEVIEGMKAEALEVKKEVEAEMMERFGFKWPVWIGFHAVPSMVHLHLHVLSADLVSDRMKNKKHYNSFHPSLGFFFHVNDVLEWFDADESYFNRMAQLTPKPYEDLLKRDLECFKCESSFKNMPTLKQHLQEEWNKEEAKAKRAQAVAAKMLAHKRKASNELPVQATADGATEAEAGSWKKAKTDEAEVIQVDG